MKVTLTFNYSVNGPDKEDTSLVRKYLTIKGLYKEIFYPYSYKLKDLKIYHSDKKIILKIEDIQIDDLEDFKSNFYLGFSDSWAEGDFSFGKDYYYYDTGKIVSEKEEKNIKVFEYSYYVLPYVNLPLNSKYASGKCEKVKSRKPLYFYYDIEVYKYEEDYFIDTSKTPEIFIKALNIQGHKLPKKYHSVIKEHYNYLECAVNSKYSYRSILEKDPKIDKLFLRKDNYKVYTIKDKILTRGKLNYVIFSKPVLGVL